MGSAEAAPSRGRDETRAKILQAAVELFGRDGFDATTVRAIASRCGLTDAALYYYFRTKKDILASLWRIQPSRELAASFVPGRKLNYPMLDMIIDSLFDGAAEQDPLTRIVARSILSGDQTALALRESTRANWRTMMLPYFETVFERDEAAVRVDAVMMLAIGFMFTHQIEHGPEFREVSKDESVRRHLRDLVRIAVPIPPAL